MVSGNTNKLVWPGIVLGIVLTFGTISLMIFPDAMPNVNQSISIFSGWIYWNKREFGQ